MLADTPASLSHHQHRTAPHVVTASEARLQALRLHPSNHSPARPSVAESSVAVPAPRDPGSRTDQPSDLGAIPRWERLRLVLIGQGLSDKEARTEVARIAAEDVWGGLADELREHRAAGRQTDANVAAVGLRALQGATLPIIRHPGDVGVARSSLSRARRRLHHSCGVLERLHEQSHALRRAEEAIRILEAFLRPQ